MRSEFEKWLDDKNMFMEIERKFNQEHNTYEYCAIRWIWESWQHQQSKVDELHKISVALNTETIRQREQVAYYLSKNAELQKRVDAALQLVNEMKGKRYPFSAYADQLEQALKGGIK